MPYEKQGHKMRCYILLIGVLSTVDQASKYWMKDLLSFKPLGYDIFPFFKLHLSTNMGISFSFFSSNSPATKWAIISVSCLLCMLLFLWLKKSNKTLTKVGLSLIIGGAIGNIIDRFVSGGVTDFIMLYYNQYYFPTFNGADIFIFCGVGALLLEDMFAKKQ